MNNSLENYVEELIQIDSIETYDAFIDKCVQSLYDEYELDVIQNVKNIGKYLKSPFSDKATKESMLKSKENLLFYLRKLLLKKQNVSQQYDNYFLENYLNHFYLFLEALKEIEPDKRASLKLENLQKIKIENEYDLQHLLYAILKLIYIDIRKEVVDDSGLSAMRSDFFIPSINASIEAKCTRDSMNYRKLKEEIEADIVHYNTDFIYFYIYDKVKLIKDREVFKTYFNRRFDDKEVRVIILQPISM